MTNQIDNKNVILSRSLSATPKRGGDIDMRYYPQLRIMAKDIHLHFSGVAFPKHLRIGLFRDNGWLHLTAYDEDDFKNSHLIVEKTETHVEPTSDIIEIFGLLNDAVSEIKLLNPAPIRHF